MKNDFHINLTLIIILFYVFISFLFIVDTNNVIEEQQNSCEVDQRVLKELQFSDKPSVSLDYIQQKKKEGALK